jgi:hypothetical protein
MRLGHETLQADLEFLMTDPLKLGFRRSFGLSG